MSFKILSFLWPPHNFYRERYHDISHTIRLFSLFFFLFVRVVVNSDLDIFRNRGKKRKYFLRWQKKIKMGNEWKISNFYTASIQNRYAISKNIEFYRCVIIAKYEGSIYRINVFNSMELKNVRVIDEESRIYEKWIRQILHSFPRYVIAKTPARPPSARSSKWRTFIVEMNRFIGTITRELHQTRDSTMKLWKIPSFCPLIWKC